MLFDNSMCLDDWQVHQFVQVVIKTVRPSIVSRGTKLDVGDLCIQNTDRNNDYPIQEENKYRQNKYS